MNETCPFCGKEFENTKALGSHIHYVHGTNTATGSDTRQSRSDDDKKRFQRLVDSCASARGLRTPREVEKIEQAIVEIPEGISPTLDKYRDAFKCAITKEKLLKAVEEELLKGASTEETK